MRNSQIKRFWWKKFKPSKKHIKYIAIAALIFIVGVPIFTYAYFSRDLDSKESIMNRNNTGVTLLDKNGKPFYTLYEARVTDYASIDEIPDHVEKSLVAAEDKSFYEHQGFSIKAMLGALYADIVRQDLAFGGSTITQQLVKNTLLTDEKSFLRKYQELVLATEIERRYSKEEILEMYLNSVYFGEGAFGIEAASEAYYGKSSEKLKLVEGAQIIGLLPAPSAYSPISGSKESAKKRLDYVLNELEEQGVITEEAMQTAMKADLKFQKSTAAANLKAPHFAQMVKDELVKQYGEEKITRSGYKVTTGLDMKWQKTTEQVVERQVDALAGSNVSNGAAVVQDPVSGEIRALVGSKDWNNPEFGTINMAASPRQPGSSFKPIYFAAALDQRLATPATILHDEPTDFGGYTPQNYDRQFRGDVTLRRALSNSLNIPAVELMEDVGVRNTLNTAKDFGLTTIDESNDYGLSLALGTAEVPLVEMTGAYSTFARKGMQQDPVLIKSIENKNGDEVPLDKDTPTEVISPEASFLVSSILSDKNSRREIFGNLLDTPITAAVKTGSTEDYRDSWTIGYTPNLTIGVWIGNSNREPMNNVAGSVGAAPIWRELITDFSNGKSEEFDKPFGIVEKRICSTGAQSSGTEYFISGTEPDEDCNVQEKKPKPKKKDKPEKDKKENKPIEEELVAEPEPPEDGVDEENPPPEEPPEEEPIDPEL